MTVEIIDCEQGTEGWFEAKLGIPSASRFSDVLAGGAGKVRSKYMRQLAGEIITGVTREEYSGRAMARGIEQEPDLLSLYKMMADQELTPVGFVRRKLKVGYAGASPDCFVGEKGIVQIKSAAPDILIEIMNAGRVPPEHIPQIQGEMFVTGREWCEIAIGYAAHGNRPDDRPMPLFRRKVRPDTTFHARLELALEVFNEQLFAMVEEVRKYGTEKMR